MTCDSIPIEPTTRAAVAMAPCPGFWAGSMWQLLLDAPASVRVDGDLRALLQARGIGSEKLDEARARADMPGEEEWRGYYQEEILDWLDDRHGPGLSWAEVDVHTNRGDVPALLAFIGENVVACVAPVVQPDVYKRLRGARLELIGGGGQ